VAVALLRGKLKAHDYEDVAAADPRIDQLRSLMTVTESQRYNESYLDKSRRANPTAIEVCFKDGSSSGVVEVEYPAGHPRRRKEAMPMLLEKFHQALALRFPAERQRAISAVCLDHQRMLGTPVSAFTELFAN
jgi:2-methylcitrate dehydratase PrpD